jgi:hypothetical protein
MSDPEDAEQWAARARLYRAMGESAEEVADLSLAVELDPNDSTSQYWLAKALAKHARHRKSIRELEMVPAPSAVANDNRSAKSISKSAPPSRRAEDRASGSPAPRGAAGAEEPASPG